MGSFLKQTGWTATFCRTGYPGRTDTSANLDGCLPGRGIAALLSALTIAREQSVRFAVGLMAQQAMPRSGFPWC